MARWKTALLLVLVLTVPMSCLAQESRPADQKPNTPEARKKQRSRKARQAMKALADKLKIQPTLQDVRYGPHDRNVLDFWKAKLETPTPIVIYIHGGGFRAGSKSNVNRVLLDACLKSGISVASISYRLSPDAHYPAFMLDGARAVQFVRSKAKKWNIDPKRVAASGGSAGAGISLWIGFHDDLADPTNDDLVARQSTRLTCMGVFGAQTSYDPRWMTKHIGGKLPDYCPGLQALYGITADQIDTPQAYKMYEAASPIHYVTTGDPPVFMFYTVPRCEPGPDTKWGEIIHHPKFGDVLKTKLDPLGIECIVRTRADYKGKPKIQPELDMVRFFMRHFGIAKDKPIPTSQASPNT